MVSYATHRHTPGGGTASVLKSLHDGGFTVRICPSCAGPVLDGQASCTLCGAPAPAAKAKAARPREPVDDPARAAAPNCYECQHFMITHQPGRSRACTLFGFKGDELPSYVVFHVTGKPCIYFVKRSAAD